MGSHEIGHTGIVQKIGVLLTANMLDVSPYHFPVVITPDFYHESVVVAHDKHYLIFKGIG